MASDIFNRMQIVASALILSTLLHVILGGVLMLLDNYGLVAEESYAQTLSYALFAAGVAAVIASFVMRRLLFARFNADKLPSGALFQCVITPLILAESSGVMGLVVVLLTGNMLIAGLLWGISFGAGVLHFPTRTFLKRHLDDEAVEEK